MRYQEAQREFKKIAIRTKKAKIENLATVCQGYGEYSLAMSRGASC